MRYLIAIALVATMLSACGASPSPSATADASAPSIGSRLPVTECLGGLDQATCDRATDVALATVMSSGWTTTHLWINSGSLAPIPDLLFDPNANFPAPATPDGGTMIGNAEVAFVQTDMHAGMNLFRVGSDLRATLVGYRVPLAGWCSGSCPTASSTDGPFRLELVMPHLDWKSTDAMTGMAILSYDGSAPITIHGAGASVIGFSYAEVGGRRKVDPVRTADCAPHPLDPATPINVDLSKSGAISNDDPNVDFLRDFLSGSDVRLPVGTWDVTALAIFTGGDGCAGVEHSMAATLRVTVGG
jgi:hypothetical protein